MVDDAATGCGTRRFRVLWTPSVPGCWVPAVADNCICSELTAIGTRLMSRVPLPTPAGLARLQQGLGDVAKRLKNNLGSDRAEPISRADQVARYDGAKRRKYAAAAAVLDAEGYCPRSMSRLKMFVKAEKTNYHAKSQVATPRVILARHPEYNLELGRHLYPLEKALIGMTGWHDQGVPATRLIGKGLTWYQSAALLAKKMSHFERCAVISVDASSWDQHVTEQVLSLEHSFWVKHSMAPRTMRRLLDMQKESKGSSGHGARFTIRGRRCTGDPNTGCGNTLLMVSMVRGLLSGLGLTRWDLLDDGDDCLILVELAEVDRVMPLLKPAFLEYGQELKVEEPVTELGKVTFCRSRVLSIDGRLRFIRPWNATLSGLASSHIFFSNQREREAVMKTILMGEAVVSTGVPIVGPVVHAMLKRLEHVKRAKYADWTLQYAVLSRGAGKFDRLPDSVVPSPSTRAAFETSWGVSPAEQEAIEQRLISSLGDFTAPLAFKGHACLVGDSGNFVCELPIR